MNNDGHVIFERSASFIMMLAGFFMLMLVVSVVYYCYMVPEFSAYIVSLVAIRIGVNRVASLFFGYAIGLHKWWVWYINILIELGWTFFFYGLFLLTWHNLIQAESLRIRMNYFVRVARRYQEKVGSFGYWGLFLFVAVPLPLTGPFIGAILGFLMGLKHWSNLLIVQAGAIFTFVVWSVLLLYLNDWALSYGRYVSLYVFVLIVMGFIILKIFRKFKASVDQGN